MSLPCDTALRAHNSWISSRIPAGSNFPWNLQAFRKARQRLRPGRYVARVAARAENSRPKRSDFLIKLPDASAPDNEHMFVIGERSADLQRRINDIVSEVNQTTEY